MGISESRPPLALIAGPTASGKSALALELAERSGGVIVNADSAQVYRDLPIISAAPTAADQARAEHRLYGILGAAEPCSAADWAALAKKEIARIRREGKLPILTGGTGLYLRTLLDGIAPVPEIDAQVRDEVRRSSVEHNHAKLGRLDTAAAQRLNPRDTSRIARALEVVLSTGRTLADWQLYRDGGIRDHITLRPLILLPPRDWLRARCDRRFERMVNAGAVEEAQALLSRHLSPHLPAMRAIGVREIAALIRGEISREDAIAAGQRATRQYAKRQYTWFAHQPPADWPRFTAALDPDGMTGALALLTVDA